MYGFSDQAKPIPETRFRAERHGSSRYSTREVMTTHRTEHVFAEPVELEPGILRLTLPLPSGPRHVHCYLLRGDDGWLLVDTGLGLMETPWQEILARLDGPVVRALPSASAVVILLVGVVLTVRALPGVV